MELLHEIPLRPAQSSPRTAGCVFVPTMGALHAGHAALIGHARSIARDPDRTGRAMRPGDAADALRSTPALVVVSIFVNPTQFNDPKDLERYPRTLDADVELCRAAGADLVFAPSVETVYPGGPALAPARALQLPAVADGPGLEDAYRPGHFAGVCRVVSRLFDLTAPRWAIFGEKDWQQLQVIRAMTLAQGRHTTIVPSETVRESDGLAMSSRNRFLTPHDRLRARAIPEALAAAAREATLDRAEQAMRTRLERDGLVVEYAVVRDATTLLPPAPHQPLRSSALRALIAARLGSVRLLDNAPWGKQLPA